MGQVLKEIPLCTRGGEVLPGKVEIRNTCKDMRLMAVDVLCWTGEKGRFTTDTGRGCTIRDTDTDTGIAYSRLGKRKPVRIDLDPQVPSGADELICRSCGQGTTDGVSCMLHAGTVCYSHCFRCSYGNWNGDYQECRCRFHKEKRPALW